MIFINILSVYGSLASVVGLLYEFRDPSNPLSTAEISLCVVPLTLTIIWTVMTVWNYYTTGPYICGSEQKIIIYMRKWISHPGRVVIFTRDMSWAKDEKVKSLLTAKAENNELTIILEREIPLACKLRSCGAKIITYEALRHTPASRFTIINKDRHDAQVAVGGKVNGSHVINEFQKGHHPFFAVANDLAEIIIKYDELKNEKNLHAL